MQIKKNIEEYNGFESSVAEKQKKADTSKMNRKQIAKSYFKASLHYGASPNKWNPKMAPYILEEKNGYHIIDIFKTMKFLKLAGNIVEKKARVGKTFLFVGTSKYSAAVVSNEAKKVNAFYINYRWLGGTLTNWPTLQKRIQKLRDLEQQEANGEFDKLGRKELNRKKKVLEKLKRGFSGIKNMTGLPDVVIFTNQIKERLAILECTKLGIPAICIVDTDCDPDLVPYPIPANDDSKTSINFIVKNLAERIGNGYEYYNEKYINKEKTKI